MLTEPLADRFAGIALGHVTREYPHKLDHVLDGDGDALPPRALHPVFFGSFDWHSCVHGYWLLARILRRFPEGRQAGAIRALFDRMLVPDAIAGELAYLDRPSSATFERTYGWAWLLALDRELADPWRERIAPLARAFATRFHAFLPRLTYPIRAGTHANSAFAVILAYPWARTHDAALAALLAERAARWFSRDRAAQAWEPAGDEFLSPTLVTAAAMQAVTSASQFRDWFTAFLPELAVGRPETLFTPAIASDRTDGKIAHLDGLNLSRAWCWRRLACALDGPARRHADEAADRHVAASLPFLDIDYAGSHWLATFALLAHDDL